MAYDNQSSKYGEWTILYLWPKNSTVLTYYTLDTKFSEIRIYRISTCRTQSETNEIELNDGPNATINDNVKKLKNSRFNF